MSFSPKRRIGRLVAGAVSVLMVAAGLTMVTETTRPLTAAAAQSPTVCRGTVALTNGGFESPTIPSNAFRLLSENAVPGWFTNDSRGEIEFWGTGFNGVPAAEGRQFAELNANTPSLLYHDVETVPGETLAWSLDHRGRGGVDTMRVVIGAPGGTLTQSGPNISDGTTAWGRHTGRYTIPAGQTVTRFGFEAVSSAGGDPARGNLLDNISFGTSPCLITTKSVTNLTRGGASAEVGDVLRYSVTSRNDGGNSAPQSVSTDVLGPGLDIVPGSLRIIAGSGVGALTNALGDDRGEYVAGSRSVRVRLGDNATTTAGGTIAVGASTTYTFDATVGTVAAAGTIRNEATVIFFDDLAGRNQTSTSQETTTSVAAASDLAITKSLDTPLPVAGRPATFTIGVTNRGPQTATGVTVTDAVPAGFGALQMTPTSGSCTIGAEISCSLPDLPVGASASITVTGIVSTSRDPGGALTNVASVSGSRTDPDPSNNTAIASGTVAAVADVSVTKSFSPAVPVAGQDVTYTLTTRNDGPSVARDVTLLDPLDPRTPFVSVSPSQGTCAVAGGRLDCTFGSLAPGASAVTTLVVRIPPGAAARLQNTVSIASSTNDPDPGNDVAVTSFQPDIVSDLTIAKTASESDLAAGETVDFTLSARNLGPANATNVSLDDTLPDGFTVTGVTSPPGAACAFTGPEVRCTWASLAVGGPANVVVRAVVSEDAPDGTVTNTASIAAPVLDPNPQNNSASVDVDVAHSADVSVQKSAPASAVPGLPYVYTIDIANTGPSTARGVHLTDVLPEGFAFESADGDCALEGSTLTCEVGDLADEGTARIQVSGTWATALSGSVENTASVDSPTPDPDGTNNTSTVSRTFSPRADVSVVKTSSTPSVVLGADAQFLVTVRNDGPSAAVGVAVDDAVPTGLLITAATPSVGTWAEGDEHWSAGTLQPGESATLALTARVAAEGALTNTVTATSQTPDPDPTDNTGSVTITATPSADLRIVKSASASPAPVNGPLTYTIVVTNDGPSPAQAVRITDDLPAALLEPTTPTAGCTISAGVLDCAVSSLAVGATFTARVSGTVDAASALTDLSNTAVVSSSTADPDPADNSSVVTVPLSGAPRVELVKTASSPVDRDADGRIDAGDTVSYAFAIRNIGDVALTGATVTDAMLGGAVACTAFAPPLRPGAQVSCAPVEYTLTQADIDEGGVVNTASVVAQSARGEVTDEAEANETVPASNGIALSKAPSAIIDVNGDGKADAGDSIMYTFTVTNTGTTTLRDARVTDAMLGGEVVCAALEGVDLAPGAVIGCDPVPYTFVQEDIDDGVVRNTATATASAPTGSVSDSAVATAAVGRTESIDLTKTVRTSQGADGTIGAVQDVDADGSVGAGDTVDYTFSVENTGTTTLSGVVITDPLLGPGVHCTLGVLAPGETDTCGPFPYVLTQADIEAEVVRNTATADATGPLGSVSDDATADIVIEGTSAIALTKTPGEPVDANDDGRIGAGDTVAFVFGVRNTGTTVLRDIVIDDPLLGGALDCPTLDGRELLADAEAECGPVEYTLTQADIDAGTVRNTATGVAESVLGAVEDEATAEVDVVGASGIALTKTAAAVADTAADGLVGAGDTVPYSFTIRNTGTTVLRDLAIGDPMLGGAVDCAALDGAVLLPTAELECGPTNHTLTQADVERGSIRNIATATADSALGAVDDTAASEIDVVGTPAVTLEKSAGAVIDTVADGRTGAGDTVGYRFTVRNTGSLILTEAAIADPLLGGNIDCPALSDAPLAPGVVGECGPIAYALSQADADAGTVRNEASVTAGSVRGSVVDEAETDVAVPGTNGITLDKAAGSVVDVDGDGAIGEGDTIAYTFTVSNTGTTTLGDARITDPMLGGAVGCDALGGVELAPDDTVTCAPVVHILAQGDVDAGQVRNEATVRATAPRGETVEDTAAIDVSIGGTAGIEVQKSAGSVTDVDGDGAIGEGDAVAYDFVVRNAGTTTLQDLTIDDEMLGGALDCPALDVLELAPGEDAACGPVPYTLTQDDVDEGIVRNTASAAGTGPLGPVRDDASVDVVVVGTSGVELTKTPDAVADMNDDGMIGAGDTVGYSFSIRNTGTTVLRDIVVDDPLLGGAVDCPSLDGLLLNPQAEATCGPTIYTLVQADIDAGTVHNEASVVAQSPAGQAEDADEADVAITGTDRVGILKSAAAIVDADENGRTNAGDTIAYTFTVRNPGTTTLTGIVVADPRLSGAIVCDATMLAPSEATLCTGEPAVLTQDEVDAGEIVNTATVTATGRGSDPQIAQSTIRTPIENQPSIGLVKTGGEYVDENGDDRIGVGDSVAFRFVVTNTGARTLSEVAIDDPELGGPVACEIPDLAPGETAECGPVRYALTAADVASGEVVNVASVTAAAGGVVVSAAASVVVDVRALAATGGVIAGIGVAVALVGAGGFALWFSRRAPRPTMVYRDSA